MSPLQCLCLLVSIISVNSIQFGYDIEEICLNLVTYFNLMNMLTPLRLDIYFERGTSLLHDNATIEFTSDVVTSCTSLPVSRRTFLISVEVTGDIFIRTHYKTAIILEECVIASSLLLEKQNGRVFVKTQFIENTGFRNGYVEGKGRPLVEDLIVPFLSRALRSSEAAIDVSIGQLIDYSTLGNVTEHLLETIGFYLTRFQL